MTAPDNGMPANGMEEALRRALAEVVGQVEPGADALDRIRARIARRPPRPWLASALADLLGRARNWTWRGHWAWQLSPGWPAAIPAPSALSWPRLRRLPAGQPRPAASSAGGSSARRGGPFRPDTVGWLRPVAVLAGIALIASVSLGVQPFRQAIIAASSTVLSGGQQQSGGGAGTDGNGTVNGNVASSSRTPSAPGSSYGSAPATTRARRAGPPRPARARRPAARRR